jgi:hypothetical protein
MTKAACNLLEPRRQRPSTPNNVSGYTRAREYHVSSNSCVTNGVLASCAPLLVAHQEVADQAF